MTLRLANITFDCADPLKVSAFWSAALGIAVDPEPNEYFASLNMGRSDGNNAWLFIAVPEGKSSKNRTHVDLQSDDRGAEVARLVALGANEVGAHDEWGHQWTVLHDPEGNEFCVS